jgi:hypothetical protein
MSLPCLGNSFWSMSTFKGGTSAGENPPWPIDQWGNGWFHDGTGDPKTAQSRLAPTSMSQEQRSRFGILSIYRYTYWLLNRGNPLLININQSVGTEGLCPKIAIGRGKNDEKPLEYNCTHTRSVAHMDVDVSRFLIRCFKRNRSNPDDMVAWTLLQSDPPV